MRVGVDIGGTKTHAVALGDDGRVVQQVRLPTGSGPEAVLAAAVESVNALTGLTGVGIGGFESIGVGVPGAVDHASGRVTHAVNLGLDDLDLGGELEARLGVLVRVENDVNAAAFGSFHRLGSTRTGQLSDRSMAYLNLGTGLAAGLVLKGELWRGARGAAGEIGHIPVDPNGPVCSCGQRGCLEMMASGSTVARQWPTSHPRPVQELFEAAAAGNALALKVRRSLVENVAAAVRVLVLTVDVDFVVIGGGISSVGEPLVVGVRAVLGSWAGESPFLASLELPERVAVVPVGYPAAAVGAALIGALGSGATMSGVR